jgi:hypothetical protein
MEAFHGGLALNGLRGEAPVVTTDVTQMFSTMAILLGHWPLWTAKTITTDDATDWVNSILVRVTIDDLLNLVIWRELNMFCRVDVDRDILPTHGLYPGSDEWTMNRGEVSGFPRPVYWTLPDVIATILLHPDHKPPRILEAFRLVATGVQDSLRPISYRGMVDFDPAEGDFFRFMVQQRGKAKAGLPPYDRLTKPERSAAEWGMKQCASTVAWGELREVNRDPAVAEGKRKPTVEVWSGDGMRTVKVDHVERSGTWYFSPLASLIAAGSRQLLAIMQALARDRYVGGFAFTDTDSMAFVACTERGTLSFPDGSVMHVMSWDDVREIQREINRLNPYDRSLVNNLLRIEDENIVDGDPSKPQRQLMASVIAPKRHCLFTEGTNGKASRELVWVSENGLGQYAQMVESDVEGRPVEDWV